MKFFLAGLTALLLASPTIAGERVDLYDRNSKRQGYAEVDRKSGRVDLYDRHSRRTGYGNVDRHGRVELFDRNSRRVGEARITPAPRNR